MVLVLKHWKSRSSPGIKAGGQKGTKPIHKSKKAAAGQPRAAAFLVSGVNVRGASAVEVRCISKGRKRSVTQPTKGHLHGPPS